MKNLRELREQKKLTQKEVANILKIDRSTYGKYETGDSEPSIETIIALANIFETSIDRIVGYEPKNKPIISEYEYLLIQKYRKTSLEKKQIINFALGIEDEPNTINGKELTEIIKMVKSPISKK